MTGLSVRLVMHGALSATSAMPWIVHRARLLDLSGQVTRISETEIRIDVTGPDPLIDAMEDACSLGPAEILVDRIERTEQPAPQIPNRPFFATN